VYNLLGETLSKLQQYAEAERWFQASLASQPDHVPAHITYGKLLARNVSSRLALASSPFAVAFASPLARSLCEMCREHWRDAIRCDEEEDYPNRYQVPAPPGLRVTDTTRDLDMYIRKYVASGYIFTSPPVMTNPKSSLF